MDTLILDSYRSFLRRFSLLGQRFVSDVNQVQVLPILRLLILTILFHLTSPEPIPGPPVKTA